MQCFQKKDTFRFSRTRVDRFLLENNFEIYVVPLCPLPVSLKICGAPVQKVSKEDLK